MNRRSTAEVILSHCKKTLTNLNDSRSWGILGKTDADVAAILITMKSKAVRPKRQRLLDPFKPVLPSTISDSGTGPRCSLESQNFYALRGGQEVNTSRGY